MARFRISTGLVALVLLCATSAMSQGVHGVHPDISSSLEIGISYTFVSFYEIPKPSTIVNSNGFTGSAVYFHDWVGVEGDVSDVSRINKREKLTIALCRRRNSSPLA